MKIVIINAYGRSNRGDSVLLDECLSEIRIGCLDAEISVAVYEGASKASALHPDVEWSERIGNVSRPGLGFKLFSVAYLLFAYIGAVLPGLGAWRLLPSGQRKTLAAIKESDLVISAPGGYLHDANLAYLIALFHIKIATILGRPVVLAPKSIGPLNGHLPRFLTRRVLLRVSACCVREQYSFDFVKTQLGLPDTIVFRAGDSAFWNYDVESDIGLVDREFTDLGVRPGQSILGVTVVNWNFPASRDARAEYLRYVETMAATIDRIANAHGLTPIIFNQVSDDLDTARAVQECAGCDVVVDRGSREPRLMRAMIARSKVFVGTRFHSCIFALAAGRPTFAISYLPKTTFIMHDLQLVGRDAPIGSFTADDIVSKVSGDLASLASSEQEVRDAVDAYRSRFARLSDVLAELSVWTSCSARSGG